MDKLRLPDDSHRFFIGGQNGTGKTVAGLFHLSYRSYDKMPWIVVDYKRDSEVAQLPAEEISHTGVLPKHAGLFVVRPPPEPYEMEPFFRQAYERGGKCGFYIDEGTMLSGDNPRGSRFLRALMTQGRSLRIPTIILSQRPTGLSREVLSEANFFQMFELFDEEDRKTVCKRYIKGLPVNYPETLGEYESYYFDAKKKRLAHTAPLPYGQEVLDVFDRRRPKKVKRL